MPIEIRHSAQYNKDTLIALLAHSMVSIANETGYAPGLGRVDVKHLLSEARKSIRGTEHSGILKDLRYKIK
jgi:hypothetical protein